MTAPDHTPYLIATDLRTPEDVANWLDEYHPCEQVGDVAYELRAQIARERRQALRAGLRRAWLDAKFYRREERTAKRVLATPYQANIRAMMQLVIISRSKRAECIQRALAFRAAARQP